MRRRRRFSRGRRRIVSRGSRRIRGYRLASRGGVRL